MGTLALLWRDNKLLLSGFVLALVLLGYAFSTLARTQMQAMQLTFFFFLPSLLLSGFMFPYRGMPDWAQLLGAPLKCAGKLRDEDWGLCSS